MARSLRRLGLTLAMTAALATPGFAEDDTAHADAVRARDDRIADLERKLDVLASELDRVRTQVAVPEEPELKSVYGFGPAASKIYGIERGLSIGGYGEGLYTHLFDDDPGTAQDRADFLRLVLYFGYKFTDRIVFNSEIEFEHATTSNVNNGAGSGSASVELASLDFFFKPWLNFRAGLLLAPIGFINEIHEPPFFYGVKRPEVETRIIPTTWRENGAGIFGQLFDDQVQYRAYVMNNFNASRFTDAGIRGGRQKGNRALAEDFGLAVRVDWTPDMVPGLLLGGSGYWGDTGNDFVGEVDAQLIMFDARAQYQRGPFHARALFAYTHLSDARELNTTLGRPVGAPIAELMLGGYAEVAYDVWPMLTGDEGKALEPFFRMEYVDTQAEIPEGFTANERNQYLVFTPGVNFYPHPNVVLKFEYRNLSPQSGNRPDELSVGIGFAF